MLSLTGGCSTSKLDPVPDPDCSGQPLTYPIGHSPSVFAHPSGAAVDANGYVYVTTLGSKEDGSLGRLDIFDPSGHFVTEISAISLFEEFGETFNQGSFTTRFSDPGVDSAGNLYLRLERSAETTPPHGNAIVRYTPNSYPPTNTTTYSSPTTIYESPEGNSPLALAIAPANDHVYVDKGSSITEFESAAGGSGLLQEGIGAGTLSESNGVAVAASGDIFASGLKPGADPSPSKAEPFVSQLYVFNGETGSLKEEIDGSDVVSDCVNVGELSEECGFRAAHGDLGIAIDQANGDLFIDDTLQTAKPAVYQFGLIEGAPAGERYGYLSTIEHSFQEDVFHSIAVDSGPTSPNRDHLYVVSHPEGIGHLFAFEPTPEVGPPTIMAETFSGLSTSEVTLEGEVDPGGLQTGYRFEYVDDATFEFDLLESGLGHGFDHATRVPVPDEELAAGSAPVAVFQSVSGLQAGTKYHFRIFAENPQGLAEGEREGADEVEHVFATYPVPGAGLPDGRAYELVTPPDTNGRLPTATGIGIGDGFETDLVAPAGPGGGTNLLFETIGGSLPGTEGTGSINGDVYEAERGTSGWNISIAEPSGAQSQSPSAGGYSPDHRYSFWNTAGGGVKDNGSLVIDGEETHYTRMPGGSFALIGTGSTGEEDPQARGAWITAGASHLVFTSPVQLEPNAPPTPPTRPALEFGSIYDRAPDGTTRVVSLLPGDVPPASAGEIAYRGTSADGSAVAFMVGSTLYERRGETTLMVEEGSPTFAGISRDGGRVFFVKGGNIFAFDADESTTTSVGSGGESTVVNVSADGSHVYFVSHKRLEGQGKSGKDNLYAWSDGAVHLIGTLEHIDVAGKEEGVSGFIVDGLGLWTTYAVGRVGTNGGPANDPSRSSADGRFLVFQSRADLTGYDSEGHPEVYRYDDDDQSLLCVSCNPTLAPVVSGGKLQSLSASGNQFAPGNSLAPTANVTEDGHAVFFETEDALVPGDVDQAQDVYEWEAEETGGCVRAGGCLSLISSGHSAGADYLYAASRDGNNVFFRTGDQLLAADRDATPSIYDARIGGGFVEGEAPSCQGEACKGAARPPPSLPEIASAGVNSGAAPRRKHCQRKGIRRSHRGKSRCTKAHSKGRHRHRPHRRSPR
jgi:hypothetical protein